MTSLRKCILAILICTLSTQVIASRHLERLEKGIIETHLNLLSIGGGGMRGIITGILLEELRQRANMEHLHENVHYFAGVSTGSLIATGLALGIPADEIETIYREWGPRIFEKSLVRSLLSPKKELYHHQGLEETLQHHFRDKTMADLKRDIIVLAHDIEGGTTGKPGPVVFNSAKRPHQQIPLWSIPRASCSAPTIFKPFYGFEEYSMVDGGFLANNPTETAIAQILELYDDDTYRSVRDNLTIISIGTGYYREPLARQDSHSMGFLDWGPRLPTLMADGAMDLQVQNLKKVYRDHFVSLDPPLERPVALDSTDPDDLEYLRQATRAYIDSAEGDRALDQAARFIRQPLLTDVD
jgi:hypothetical protein